jgi:Mrp family chromosome partitioning ATPase
MGSHSAILDKGSADRSAIATPIGRAAAEPSPARPYAELSVRLFSAPGRVVVGFFAINHGAGVTHTIRQLANELGRVGKRVYVLDGALRPVWEPTPAFELSADLRRRFDCVLIDCGSLDSSLNLLHIAPACDGVVVVVEAGRTSRAQVARATQVVREAKGALLGFVLNKRRYPIPGWLYRML